MKQPDYDPISGAKRAEMARIAQANSDALSALMQKHGLFIQAQELHQWRPTQRLWGTIPGVAAHVIIIATNGVVGWFIFEDETVPPLFGHIGWFTGKVKPLFSTAAAKPMKNLAKTTTKSPRKPRVTKLDKAMTLLKQWQEEQEK